MWKQFHLHPSVLSLWPITQTKHGKAVITALTKNNIPCINKTTNKVDFGMFTLAKRQACDWKATMPLALIAAVCRGRPANFVSTGSVILIAPGTHQQYHVIGWIFYVRSFEPWIFDLLPSNCNVVCLFFSEVISSPNTTHNQSSQLYFTEVRYKKWTRMQMNKDTLALTLTVRGTTL